jgi:two-component system NarL family response regulator
MKEPEKIRVLIANDQTMIREGLSTVINRQKDLEVVGQSAEIATLFDTIRHKNPDVILIDLKLDGVDTFDVIRKLSDSFPKIAIIIFSSFDGSEDIYRALRAGAKGYLMKSASDSDLVEAIKTVRSGRRHIPTEIAVRLAERMDHSTLTDREHEVLLLIVKGKSNKEISDQLEITEGTVKFHVNGILMKLGVTDRTQAATAALLRGIIHPQDL